MKYDMKHEGKFTYIESNGGEETLLLLHGLFGALSNFEGIFTHFSGKMNVVVPILPIFDLPLHRVSVTGLADHVADFVQYKNFGKVHVLGNSLGGHIAILYALAHPEQIASITLTGSSGLFESAMGTSFPKRGDFDFIKKKTEATFYRPEVATQELIDEVYDIVNDRNKAIRIIATSKSAVRHNLGDHLHKITAPTLLIWGKEDQITPAFVGDKFHEMIPHSKLIFIEECGHAPMMEHPKLFNEYLETFLEEVTAKELR